MKKIRAATITTATLSAMIFAIAPAASAHENSVQSGTTGASAMYLWTNDQIHLWDTKSDGFSVYGQYYIDLGYGISINNTSQWNGGYNTDGYKTIGPLAAGYVINIRSARQVEGGADNHGSWREGVT